MKEPREPSAENSLSALGSVDSGDTPQPSLWRERPVLDGCCPLTLALPSGEWEVMVYVLPWALPASAHKGWDAVGSSIPQDFSTSQEPEILPITCKGLMRECVSQLLLHSPEQEPLPLSQIRTFSWVRQQLQASGSCWAHCSSHSSMLLLWSLESYSELYKKMPFYEKKPFSLV